MRPGASSIAMGIGLLGVFCSMMIYHDTRRVLWNWQRSAPLFFGTTFALGAAALFALNVTSGMWLIVLAAVIGTKLLVEVLVLRHVANHDLTSLKKTALLISRAFQPIAFARALGTFSGIGMALLLHVGAFSGAPAITAWLPFALVLAGEVLERMLFFCTVDAPKMPGGLAT
jgi:formate dehydrogenase iron-sulfur subunit